MERNVYTSAGDPIKVGVLMDMPASIGDWALKVYELVREHYLGSGRLERGIEFVVEKVVGPPAGTIKNTTDGYHALADAGCLVAVGPNHSDANIALPEHVEARRMPLVALGATAQHLSPHIFSIAWGSIPDDAYICASWLLQNGHKRVTMTWDRAHHSAEYVRHFRIVAQRIGIRILADERFPQLLGGDLEKVMQRTLAEHRALKPDAIVHFGTSSSAGKWAGTVTHSGWDVPRIMNGAFFGAYGQMSETVSDYEGWVGTTLWDDDNPTLARFAEALQKRHGALPALELMAHYRDAMTATLEGVTLAPILTPQGVREGLESVRMLPAAVGGKRTCISFGPYDHRGHKGADVMVLRRVKSGRIVMEGRFEHFG